MSDTSKGYLFTCIFGCEQKSFMKVRGSRNLCKSET